MAERVWQKVRFSRLFHVEHNHGPLRFATGFLANRSSYSGWQSLFHVKQEEASLKKQDRLEFSKSFSPIVVRPTIRSFSFLPEGIAEATAEWRSVHPTPNREIFEPH